MICKKNKRDIRLFDSHAHLLDPRLINEDPARGVDAVLCVFEPGEDEKLFRRFLDDERVYGACGVHPHSASEAEAKIDELDELLSLEKVLALGETGLDYYWDNSPRDMQRKVFRAQLEKAAQMNLPVVVHTRSAFSDTMRILDECRPEKVLIHCFSEGPGQAEEVLERGYFISAGGIITFKKAEKLRESIEKVPLDRLLVETDSPYLAPNPFRGKTNRPEFIEHTLKKIAEIKGVSYRAAADAAFSNAVKFFGIKNGC